MKPSTIAVINPGQMGVSVARAARSVGHRVLFAAADRSKQTLERAAEADLEACSDFKAMLSEAEVVLSVCPPAAARSVAVEVAAAGFSGLYVDCNAVSPASARAVAEAVTPAGASFVDGGIIGPPAKRAGTTRLYLSGARADEVAALFTGSVLEAIAMPSGSAPEGAASALKMAYAAYTKGTSALLIAVRALAASNGVEEALLSEWAISQAGLEERTEKAAQANAFKAWRFAGEMNEIADTFQASGLPDGFHRAAAELYEALSAFKDVTPPPSLAEVIAELQRSAKTDEAA